MSNSESFATQCRGAIICRMLSENAKDNSDAEIERTLRPCVCGKRLIEAAKHLRETSRLNL